MSTPKNINNLSRREFLKLSAGVGMGLATQGLIGGCGLGPGILEPLPDSQPTTARASVAAIRGKDLYTMTRQALEAIGGIETIVKPGETVFIKPNFLTVGLAGNNPFADGECTKPEILIVLAEQCLKSGASEVIIGDGAQVTRFSWEAVVTLDGSTNLAAEAQRLNATYDGKVTLACLNADSPEWDALPSPGTSLENIYVSSLVSRADRIISVPVLKTHRIMHASLSVKNFVGVAPLQRYTIGLGYRSKLHLAAGGVEQCSLNIVKGLEPDLAIIDGSIGVEGYGPFVSPTEGRTVDMKDRLGDWLMLASTDLVAADATAARIIGLDMTYVKHLNMAYQQGLGQIREDMIQITGAKLEDLYVDWLSADRSKLSGVTKSMDIDQAVYGARSPACPCRRQ